MANIGRRRILTTGAAALLAAPALVGARGGRAAGYEITFDSNLATVGNSLIDQSVDMVIHFAARAGRGRGALAHQTIPGASMKWNWEHARAAVVDGRAVLAQGRQHVWMGVESVPFRHVQNPGDFCDLAAWVDWHRLASDNGVTRVFVFEAWHDLRSGAPGYAPEDRADPDAAVPWRQRIEVARPHWERIAEHVNARRRPGDPAVALIPGGRTLAAIHDDIRRGAAPPRLAGIGDLFADSIHPNVAGRYAMACVMYACLYRRSPEGLPAATADVWGRAFERVPGDLAGYLQKVAWSTARADARSGVAG
jgi:hypothetical protein